MADSDLRVGLSHVPAAHRPATASDRVSVLIPRNDCGCHRRTLGGLPAPSVKASIKCLLFILTQTKNRRSRQQYRIALTRSTQIGAEHEAGQ